MTTPPTEHQDTPPAGESAVDAAVRVALQAPRAQTLSIPRSLTGDAYRAARRRVEAAHMAEARRYRRVYRRRRK